MRFDAWSIALRWTTVLISWGLHDSILSIELLLDVIHDKRLELLLLDVFLVNVNIDVYVTMVDENGRLFVFLCSHNG